MTTSKELKAWEKEKKLIPVMIEKYLRERIKDVMKWAGPRMIFTHPVFAFRHVFQMISYKRKLRKEAKAKGNV